MSNGKLGSPAPSKKGSSFGSPMHPEYAFGFETRRALLGIRITRPAATPVTCCECGNEIRRNEFRFRARAGVRCQTCQEAKR